MNIEEKTKLANKVLLKLLDKVVVPQDFKDSISLSWVIVDEMEAEAEKRIKAKEKKDAEESKVIFENLTKNEDGLCKHIHTTLNRGECFDCGEKLNSTDSSQLEFQVDWSQAPDGYDWWAMDEYDSWWFDQEPKWINTEWAGYVFNKHNRSATEKAPSFNYQGDWKDSLRKRP